MQSAKTSPDATSQVRLEFSSDDGVVTETDEAYDIDNDSWNEKHYWYGKIHVQDVLASQILRGAHRDQTSTDLDFALDTTLSSLPFLAYCEALEATVTSVPLATLRFDLHNERRRFLTMVGAVSRSGTEEEMQQLHDILCSRPIPDQSAGCGVRRSPISRVPVSRKTNLPAPEDDGSWVSGLQMYLDLRGEKANYSYEHMLNPIGFCVTLRFPDRCFSGTGKSKKEARQMAARRACERLGING